MKNKILFALSAVGLVLGLVSAHIYSQQPAAQPPVFKPAANPYGSGIYANGIIESDQADGENININPEVTGPVTQILVAEGAPVKKGQPLLTIDDSVQRATVEQDRAQMEAARSLLDELKAEPRPEALDVAQAQVENARAGLKNAQDQLDKDERSYKLDPRSVSLDTLDNARNADNMAATNLKVAQKQYDLTKAGAWSYDIANQQNQYEALAKATAAAEALLAKYTLRAPSDGVVLSLQAAVGTYVAPQGAYETYTQAYDPLIVMGAPQTTLQALLRR
jgi:HlyD family secretion protein